jgi:hypothetical protein
MIAEFLEIPASVIYSHLVEKIGLENVLLRWAPHALTSELQWRRVEFSSQLLSVFENQQRIGFHDIVTGDESWFLEHYDDRQTWCISADEVATRVMHAIAPKKTMLTVFLSINGAILINWPPLGQKLNSGYSCKKLVETLSEILHSGRAAGPPRPIVNFDNARPHRSAAAENYFQLGEFRHAPQPPYSRGISRCDLFLFGNLKRKLKGEEKNEFNTMERAPSQS